MTTKKANGNGKPKRPRAKQQTLPIALRGPDVEKLLNVSHVTVINLVKAGKLRRIADRGAAAVSGGGYLYDAEQVKALAKEYNPQQWNKQPKGKKKRAPKAPSKPAPKTTPKRVKADA